MIFDLQNDSYTTEQIKDLSDKLEQADRQIIRGGNYSMGLDPHEKRLEDKLSKSTKDCCKTTIESIHGLISQILKDDLFNKVNISLGDE